MKSRLNPIVLALLAATSGLSITCASSAAVLKTEPLVQTSTIIINGEDLVGRGSSVADIDVTLAEAAPGLHAKEVQIHAFADKGIHAGFADVEMVISSAMSEAFANAGNGAISLSRNPVKNAPYSAEVISEKIQTLPDGNQISRQTSTLAFRDSAGRTRQETRDANGNVKSIHVNDAVESARFVISPSTKTATRIGFGKDVRQRIEEMTEKARAMAKDAKSPVTFRSESNGDTLVIKRSEEAGADGKKQIREEVKVRVVRAGDSPGNPGEARAYSFAAGAGAMGNAIGESMRVGPIGMSFQDGKWSSRSTVTELGTRDFEGVRAEGKRRSYTIPAGEIGNRNPITVTSETWFSPELQVTVYSRQSDPRTGDSIYRLANVKRTEQPLTLFSVPSDYTIRDGLKLDPSTLKLESGTTK